MAGIGLVLLGLLLGVGLGDYIAAVLQGRRERRWRAKGTCFHCGRPWDPANPLGLPTILPDSPWPRPPAPPPPPSPFETETGSTRGIGRAELLLGNGDDADQIARLSRAIGLLGESFTAPPAVESYLKIMRVLQDARAAGVLTTDAFLTEVNAHRARLGIGAPMTAEDFPAPRCSECRQAVTDHHSVCADCLRAAVARLLAPHTHDESPRTTI